MIKITIDSKIVETQKGKTILEAALDAGIYIPNLCYHPDLSPNSTCRLCIVQIDNIKGYQPACTKVAEDKMVISTNTKELNEMRKSLLWLILSEYKGEIDKNTQFGKVIDYIGRKELLAGKEFISASYDVISDNPLFERDPNKCILCGKCVKICKNVRGLGAIGVINRGIESVVSTSYDAPLTETECRMCCSCVQVCPTGALRDKDINDETNMEKVLLPCTNACPAGVNIPMYITAIAEKRFQDAIETIREKVPFPHVLCHVCPHPCEDACRRGKLNEPISIKELKRVVAEKDDQGWKDKLSVLADTGKKVAVIGSGPAGLTCAWFLKLQGHSVTVYESMPKAGGMLRLTIPRYRLPESVLEKEIKNIEDIGVKIVYNEKITSINKLFKNKYDAVFIAIGATEVMPLGLPGEEDGRVLDGVSVLESINYNKGIDLGDEIAIVGGGNVAIDVARTALRLGVKKVSLLYRRTRKEMPASPEEIECAIEEGVIMEYLVAPNKIISSPEMLEVECIKMELGEPDASGRRRPVPIDGSNFIIKVDRLIKAIGQKPAIETEFATDTDRSGRVIVDEVCFSTSRPSVFAGGDVVTGPATVIEAIHAGRKAAIAIDEALGGTGQIERKFVSSLYINESLEKRTGFSSENRAHVECIPMDERKTSFNLVEKCLNEDIAIKEADRCLRCNLRLNISKVPLP